MITNMDMRNMISVILYLPSFWREAYVHRKQLICLYHPENCYDIEIFSLIHHPKKLLYLCGKINEGHSIVGLCGDLRHQMLDIWNFTYDLIYRASNGHASLLHGLIYFIENIHQLYLSNY